jgi:transcription-repair coupling factor (superfamily II helicase)
VNAISTSKLLEDDVADFIRQSLPAARFLAFSEPPGAASVAVAEAFRRDNATSAVVVVLPDPIAFESALVDARSFCDVPSLVREYPMPDVEGEDSGAVLARLSAIDALRSSGSGVIVVTCVQALMQTTPDPSELEKASRYLSTGDETSMDDFIEWLSKSGYKRESEVFEPNTFAVKGGILDLWPIAARGPSRLEFFGDEIESIRNFNHLDQRSIRVIHALRIAPVRYKRAGEVMLHDYIPDNSVVIWINHEEIELEAVTFQKSAQLPESCSLEYIRSSLLRRDEVRQFFSGDPPPSGVEQCLLPFGAVDGLASADAHRHDPDFMATQRRRIIEDNLEIQEHRKNIKLYFCLDTQGGVEHLAAELKENPADVRTAPLSGGFLVEGLDSRIRAIYLSQADLYGHSKRIRGRVTELAIAERDSDQEHGSDEMAELSSQILDTITPGSLVVHIEYGIGKYLGIRETEIKGKNTETLCIEYANHTKVYVPITNANLVSGYKGAGDAPVKLHSISGNRWKREKLSANDSIQTFALRMLETQARRKQMEGHAFSPVTSYMQEFEASFPYTETKGQAECIRQVKRDMESSHPMDRIVCGDAGYGKTEVAIRAAFISAMQGRQVAVLVPTTVLAQQHYDTFVDRMGAYPVNIAMHSRFCSRAQRDAALEGIADGRVDIIIGTHGIIQPHVKFKNLGLVIIDEEQRFGVRHKEMLKTVRLMVDVLTLSATPIPRTLYLGLTGARDMSLLQTPPRERVATVTKIVHHSDELIKKAILSEVNRGGQVFYLHNRVLSIDLVHKRLRELLPHVRIAVGHGQMPPSQIENIMRDFAAGKYDVLLCTTIIENGIDIPRANTILIDRADRFGIADLYQLRGRVGRSGVKAYAYFMIPPESYISSDARQRLKALQQHSGLGSGVSLSMRDLSIRGAGNILGAEQSGHISAIGFNMYCQLLKVAVARLRGKNPPPAISVEVSLPFLERNPSSRDDEAGAYVPYEYIEDDSRRIELYSRLAECRTQKDIDELAADTSDRFGAAPSPFRRLLEISSLRILASSRGISRIDMQEDELVLHRNGIQYRTSSGKRPRPAGSNADELLVSIRNIIRGVSN